MSTAEIVHPDGRIDAVHLYDALLGADQLPKVYGNNTLPRITDELDLLRSEFEENPYLLGRINEIARLVLDFGTESCHDGIRFGVALRIA